MHAAHGTVKHKHQSPVSSCLFHLAHHLCAQCTLQAWHQANLSKRVCLTALSAAVAPVSSCQSDFVPDRCCDDGTLPGVLILLMCMQISGVVYMFRYPPQTALAVGLSMAQIGEFAFVLLSVASQLGLMPYQVYMLLMGQSPISCHQCSHVFPPSADMNTML